MGTNERIPREVTDNVYDLLTELAGSDHRYLMLAPKREEYINHEGETEKKPWWSVVDPEGERRMRSRKYVHHRMKSLMRAGYLRIALETSDHRVFFALSERGRWRASLPRKIDDWRSKAWHDEHDEMIRTLYEEGLSATYLSSRFGLSRAVIGRLVVDLESESDPGNAEESTLGRLWEREFDYLTPIGHHVIRALADEEREGHLRRTFEGTWFLDEERVHHTIADRFLERGLIEPTPDRSDGESERWVITERGRRRAKASRNPLGSVGSTGDPTGGTSNRRRSGRLTNAWHRENDQEILARAKEGRSVSSLAEEFGVSSSTINRVVQKAQVDGLTDTSHGD